ncbi:MAG: hypothetical protein JW793_15975 [Acidobacteria bacterium]|nr:hypothetical protein [Acidobacteriota bacterium]
MPVEAGEAGFEAGIYWFSIIQWMPVKINPGEERAGGGCRHDDRWLIIWIKQLLNLPP